MSINLLREFIRRPVLESWKVVEVFREGWPRSGFDAIIEKGDRIYAGSRGKIVQQKHGSSPAKSERNGAQLGAPQ
jgi:hypothetical protein